MRRFGIGSRSWVWLPAVCAVALAGCAGLRSSGIDPSGERVFAGSPFSSSSSPPYYEHPGGMLPWDNTQVIVTPARTIAPVGSDVVLVAGVRGQDQYLRTNERVEWTLAPGGVGQIVDYGRGTWTDLAFGDFNWPHKITDSWAVTSTSRRYLRLNQETPSPSDDVLVLRGQTWVTLSSAQEGTSYVTAFAPSVYGWAGRKQTAVIHWVDAEFCFPPPAINTAGGRHVFTTTVTRHTDHAPCPGWVIRYQITSGPPAGFSPQGGSIVEVATNAAGQASAEIFQTQPTAGVNQILIQVVRPPGSTGACGSQVPLRQGSTTATWSAASLALRKSGPSSASIGGQLTYRIDVTNPGDLPADDVQVTDEIPAGMEYLDSSPKAQLSGTKLLWPLGRIGARQTRGLEVRLRAARNGSVNSCAEATAAGGLSTRDCVTTAVGAAAVEVKVLGPSSVRLGDEASFEILVTNRGQVPATGLLIKDHFDAGLTHAEAQSPIEKDLPDVAPGQTHRIGVMFRTTRAGDLCQEVTVTGDGGLQASGRTCVRVLPGIEGSATPPGAALPGTAPPPSSASPAISVTKTGPIAGNVGQLVLFRIQIRNTGSATLTNVRIVDTCDASLKPKNATPGYQTAGQSIVWVIPSLAPGAEDEFQLECNCLAPSIRTCNRVSVTTAEGARGESEACLGIHGVAPAEPATEPAAGPAPGSAAAAGNRLGISILALRNPVSVGTPNTYVVTVENKDTTASVHDLVLVMHVPEEMAPVEVGTSGPAKHAITGQTVRFDPYAELRPGETALAYRVHVNTLRRGPGRVKLRAELTSRETAQPIVSEVETEINAE